MRTVSPLITSATMSITPKVINCSRSATWKEPDGIVVIDYNWCIGCRFCVVACPYFARRFNFSAPNVPPDRINPNQGYLSNRPRFKGVVEKCTFCLQRVRRGRYPACVEVCPTGARKFGDLRDPGSEVRQVIETKRVYVFKEELGTAPRFFYFRKAHPGGKQLIIGWQYFGLVTHNYAQLSLARYPGLVG